MERPKALPLPDNIDNSIIKKNINHPIDNIDIKILCT